MAKEKAMCMRAGVLVIAVLMCPVGRLNATSTVDERMDRLEKRMEEIVAGDVPFVRKVISKEEAILRVKPDQLDELLHPIIDPSAEKTSKVIAKGLPAGPGGAVGWATAAAAPSVPAACRRQPVRGSVPGSANSLVAAPVHSRGLPRSLTPALFPAITSSCETE